MHELFCDFISYPLHQTITVISILEIILYILVLLNIEFKSHKIISTEFCPQITFFLYLLIFFSETF